MSPALPNVARKCSVAGGVSARLRTTAVLARPGGTDPRRRAVALAQDAERRLGARRAHRGVLLGTAGSVLRRRTCPRVRAARQRVDCRHNLPPRRRCCPAGVGSCRSRRGRCRSGPASRRARRGRHALGEIPVHRWNRRRIRVRASSPARVPVGLPSPEPFTETVLRHSHSCTSRDWRWSSKVSVGVPPATRRGSLRRTSDDVHRPRRLVPAQRWTRSTSQFDGSSVQRSIGPTATRLR